MNHTIQLTKQKLAVIKNFRKKLFLYFTISTLLTFLCCTGVYGAQIQQLNDQSDKSKCIDHVNRMIGTSGNGNITPVVSVPFGMIQMGADTRMQGSGYYYEDEYIIGFSHVHKSGGGCNDFLDIRFLPLNGTHIARGQLSFPSQIICSRFSHQEEEAIPGYYKVNLQDFGITTELTATVRSGIQKYTYARSEGQSLLIDLKYGSTGACTIVSEDDYDTVKVAGIEVVDKFTVRGYRITNGWAPEQHVYFYTRFSKPIQEFDIYDNDLLFKEGATAQGTNIKIILHFGQDTSSDLIVKTGISAVDMEGAQKNLEAEMPNWKFEEIRSQSEKLWETQLSKIVIDTDDPKKKEIFYTSFYNSLMYPMLYSDVDGRFRGPDFKIHLNPGFPYYGKVVGVWDTFRAACPLLTIVAPEIMNNYVRTFLEHYKIFGQLPIWVLAGGETYQMIGLHALPIITDCYYKGIRNYDAEAVYEAMKVSAMRDTSGFSMRYFVGLKNYKKYGYIPADLEMESVARTLEYAYNDWNLAQMANMLDKKADYQFFMKRATSYKNIFDPTTKLMRGRMSDGSWRTPFEPLHSNHRRDDYCEGNAWQWSFFVPHDVEGLANLMGGKSELVHYLDSLFTMSAEIEGHNTSGDITGLIGQYAHGNEPSHHIAFMYSYLGEPWKTQYFANKIISEQYNNTPNGIPGNEDTGQMSAWYVMSSIGFYPLRHGDGSYIVASPQFDKVEIILPNGKKLSIKTKNRSKSKIYIQSVKVNGENYTKPWFNHFDLLKVGKIEFVMGDKPSKTWGTQPADLPKSMSDEMP